MIFKEIQANVTQLVNKRKSIFKRMKDVLHLKKLIVKISMGMSLIQFEKERMLLEQDSNVDE